MPVDFQEDKQQLRLDELRAKEAEDLAKVLAQRYDLPYIDLSKLPINTDALRLVPETEARTAKLAAFKVTGKNLFVIILSPNNPAAQKIIEELRDKNFKVAVYLGSEASLARALERYQEISESSQTEAGVIDIASEAISAFIQEIKNIEGIKTRLDAETALTLKQGGVTNLLEIVLAGAIIVRASDIHLEPEETRLRLRYRLDGVLNDFAFFDRKIFRPLLSRVKLVSGLKLNIKTTAQDGRFSIRLGQNDIEVRTAILPGAYGESIVLRLLNPETLTVEFSDLGMEPKLFDTLKEQIAKPNGLILLTGPTGSGKTTTLYAILRVLNTAETKIITIEDPIEYHLAGINQTQVNLDKKYTFLIGLRSALRQDPDIIMVGEIRDAETAKIAINASLTGHLVLSTLHTNTAAGTIPRLIDLGVNPKIIEAALNIALAQRLVRRLCLKCRESYRPSDKELTLIGSILGALAKKRPAEARALPTRLWQPAAAGCLHCRGTGFAGRIGIFEAVVTNAAIAELLVKNPSEREIKHLADAAGLLDLREDGLLKVLDGVTALTELERVVDLYAEIL
ncbi:MAG: type II/IV secretion system protein [Candidatus Vogelbacteria bacterium]|nr:type II/IV secretion system protein [Candidatus Vogelbacteria bacterium]